MSDYSIPVYFVVAMGMLMVGVSKGGGWASLGALSVPFVALALPIDDVIGMMLPVLMLADVLAIGAHWRRWDRRQVILLIPASIVGVIIGTLFLTNAPVRLIRIVIGVIVLLFAIYKLFERTIFKKLTYKPRSWHGVLAGMIAGFTSSVAHTGGPPIAIYLLMQNLQPRIFAATAAFFFFVLNYIKVPFYYFADVFNFDLLRQFLWLLPMVPLGVWVGKWLVVRVSKELFDYIVLSLLITTALLLIFT
ncbi:MAG: sulfite exporter TauE/SafE family protein [Candidatus Promineifilaceae bacterium]|nr:sulfite exporter TauE/SafE family protein [Candidatus Promineifilaceae bacterium]